MAELLLIQILFLSFRYMVTQKFICFQNISKLFAQTCVLYNSCKTNKVLSTGNRSVQRYDHLKFQIEIGVYD